MQDINTNLSPSLQCWRDFFFNLHRLVVYSFFLCSVRDSSVITVSICVTTQTSVNCSCVISGTCYLISLSLTSPPWTHPFIRLLYASYPSLSYLPWIFLFNLESPPQALPTASWSNSSSPSHALVRSHSWKLSPFCLRRKSFGLQYKIFLPQ